MIKQRVTARLYTLRTVYIMKDWPGTETDHTENRLLTLDKRRILTLLKQKHTLSFNSENLQDQKHKGLRSTNKGLLKVPRPKTSSYEKSFSYQGILLWNALEEDTKAIRNPKHFKTRITSSGLTTSTSKYRGIPDKTYDIKGS